MGAVTLSNVVSTSADSSPQLREEMLDLWYCVNLAGGAVGFTAVNTREDVEPVLDAALERVRDGQDTLVTIRVDGELAGFAFLVGHSTPLRAHWRTVLRVMVDPDRQGLGLGLVLMDAVHDEARRLGLEHLQLTMRDGLGLQSFYERAGYHEVGRHRGAIRVAPGDDRDEIMYMRSL
ncbi:MAG: GNAT family N-acetyltransferase [Candidatus Nanopelagicales bacterium]